MVKICRSHAFALLLAAAALPSCFAQANHGSAVVTPVLKGLVFLADPKALQPKGMQAAGVVADGIDLLKGQPFRDLLEPFLGAPLTFDGLNQITHAVIAYYGAHNHPMVNAVVPEQDVENGVIQIVMTEFRVGTITTKGNRWFSDSVISAPLALHHGDTIDSAQLLLDLDAANANPFRHVNLVYQPGQERGYTDLVLETQDRFPLRFFSGFDNSGTQATGHDRWNAGVTWGNVFGLDQQVTYQFSSSTDLYLGTSRSPGLPRGPAFASQSLSWSVPLAFGDTISVSGDYERSVPNLGPDLGLLGLSGQASIRYNHALPRTKRFVEALQGGYDFKTTNNNLDFGGVAVSNTSVEIDQFAIAYSANLTDRWGVSSSSTTVFYSPGGLTPDNTRAAFASAGAGSEFGVAANRYFYLREDFTRLTKLPYGAAWSAHALAQGSDSHLLYTEQLVGGGADLLRGYPTNSILGDQGVILSNELRAPPIKHFFGEHSFGNVQFLGFWDYGSLHAHVADDVPGRNVNVSSIGLGTRYSLRGNLSAKFDYGWQLVSLPGLTGRGHLASFGLVVGN